jgi:hypothetical protein
MIPFDYNINIKLIIILTLSKERFGKLVKVLYIYIVKNILSGTDRKNQGKLPTLVGV